MVTGEKMKYKKISLSNEEDKVIKGGHWKEAYSGKYFIQSVQVWLFDKKGKIFVQKRGKLLVYPYYYDVSVSGHVDFGEDYEEAAHRELREEAGIDTELYPILKIKYQIKKAKVFTMLFMGKYTGDLNKIKLNKEETVSGEFMSIRKLKRMLKEGKKFMPSFKRFFKLYFGDWK